MAAISSVQRRAICQRAVTSGKRNARCSRALGPYRVEFAPTSPNKPQQAPSPNKPQQAPSPPAHLVLGHALIVAIELVLLVPKVPASRQQWQRSSAFGSSTAETRAAPPPSKVLCMTTQQLPTRCPAGSRGVPPCDSGAGGQCSFRPGAQAGALDRLIVDQAVHRPVVGLALCTVHGLAELGAPLQHPEGGGGEWWERCLAWPSARLMPVAPEARPCGAAAPSVGICRGGAGGRLPVLGAKLLPDHCCRLVTAPLTPCPGPRVLWCQLPRPQGPVVRAAAPWSLQR